MTRPIFHRRVLDRHQPAQRPGGQHEAAGVLAQVPREAQELFGQRQQLAYGEAALVEPGVLDHLVADLHVPVVHALGDRVEFFLLEAQCLADIPQRAAWAVAGDRGRQRGAVPPIFPIQVLDHFLAPLMLEVDIDVRRFAAFLGDEALEQHAAAQRVDLGDAGAIADDAVGGRAATLAQDALAAREGDDVVDGEEVMLVLQLGDQSQLVLDLALGLGRGYPGASGGRHPRTRCGAGSRQASRPQARLRPGIGTSARRG